MECKKGSFDDVHIHTFILFMEIVIKVKIKGGPPIKPAGARFAG